MFRYVQSRPALYSRPRSALFCPILFCSVLSSFVMPCPLLFCPVLFCSVLSSFVLSCPLLFCSVLFCSVLSSFVLSCPLLLRPVLFCYVMSSFVMSCPILLCPVLFFSNLFSSQFCTVLAFPIFSVRFPNQSSTVFLNTKLRRRLKNF